MRKAALTLTALIGTLARAAEAPVVPVPPAALVVERLALVAGASSGGSARAQLRYAASDAREVARVLEQLGGVEERDIVLLEEPDAAALQGAVARLGKRAGEIRAAGRRPELFVYYSGHSDEDGLLLGSTRLSYVQLRQDLDRVPADVRVAILDSCASGAFTRAKGGQLRPAFQVDAASRVRGHAFLTSSAADEASQESDRLRASFFTHALLTGLRGAADSTGDGVVTLNEAYQFAFQETLARTEATKSGPQHATYDINLVGSGEVILTDLHRAGAVLTLPETLGGKVFVRSTGGRLVAELQKTPGIRTDLAVDPGDYRIRVARDGRVQQVQLSLSAGQKAVLPESRLETIKLEPTARRGPDAASDLDGLDVEPLRDTFEGPGRPHVVFLTMGANGLRPDHGTVNGEAVRGGNQAGVLMELGYRHWFTDRVALEGAFVARGLQGEERTVGDTTTSDTSLVAGALVGVKYAHPLSRRHGLFLGGSVAAGAYMGVTDKSITVDGTEQDSDQGSFVGWVPGGRVRLSLDYYPTSRLLLGLDAGYSQIGRFKSFVGARRDYSGFEGGLSIGYCWGRK